MGFDHDVLVAFAKSWGLFLFIAMFICVLIYAYWPSNKKKFDEVGKSILDDNDRPGD